MSTQLAPQSQTQESPHPRALLAALRAFRRGELSTRLPDDLTGVDGQIAEAFNDIAQMVESLRDEVVDLRHAVGNEGRTQRRMSVAQAPGGWGDCVHSVNGLLDDLTSHNDELVRVVSAVAHGDLTRSIALGADEQPLRGDFLRSARTVNAMVEQLSAFGSEVARVAREVGVEGKLGAQARVQGNSGMWREVTDSVNLMASNLTAQVREIARVTTAVAQGDLTKTINVEVKGEIEQLKHTINTMVGQLSAFADEVTRVAREVGTDGILGGQAQVRGVSGVWRELTENVNSMANNLTLQVRNIAEVSRAIAGGDLSRKITVEVKGEMLELKNTINTMVDQLSSFADEVTRVAREVGTAGILGGQAQVRGVSGVWRELTENVNSMANNLTLQVRNIAEVVTAIAEGDLSHKITVDARGEILALKNTINATVDKLNRFSAEVTRVARLVGTEGTRGVQAEVRDVSGIWKELTDNVNLMGRNLTDQVRDIAEVTTAVANGDLSRKITVEVRGEILELKNTINTMVDQLSSFAAEVTRVAREVGTEGILGGQAEVRGVSGTWRELTDNVNVMARNLTEQVRGIARVVTAVANGDLEQKLTLDAKGELATLVETINNMIVTLLTFADQVTNVARDVGVEGKLGGQADVPGAAGIWRDLTNNVNELAGNLTRQVRAIGDVATAVTKGDLTQSITVEARGEVALLKDNLNQMIVTLAETTRVNKEQDWLKTNLARFTRMLQGQRDLLTVARQVLSSLAEVVDAQHGAFYMADRSSGRTVLRLFASYAHTQRASRVDAFEFGEALVGQAAAEAKRILVTDVPADYIQIGSSLGSGRPWNIVVVPILFEGDVKGVIELASFHAFKEIQLDFLEQLLESLGIVVATIEATMRTDELLRQSQSLAQELQTQQEELQQTNEQLEEKARQLTEQKLEVERKNHEVELAKEELEEKAEQLALTSRYKSQFLANMSHELRTPLNSLLILSRQLSENHGGNLSPPQVEYAQTINQAGADLLALINEILDLAKIESGTMAVDVSDIPFVDLCEYVERSFGQVAAEKKVSLSIELSEDLPQSIRTDDMRLRQVLRNLLSNAFKFTDRGEVRLSITLLAPDAARFDSKQLSEASAVIAFSISDSGIGIAKDKQQIIFEAFQQADGGTSRRYGGTGLGLSISREIAALLGGELSVASEVGAGSTFTLYLPLDATPAAPSRSEPPLQLTPVSAPPSSTRTAPKSGVSDDFLNITPGDRVLLIIEDEPVFARALLAEARAQGFRGVVAPSGAQGLQFARELVPQAITLDLRLPDMDGWVVLDRLKHDAQTRHVPVYVISAVDEAGRSFERGAFGFLHKPTRGADIERAVAELVRFLDRRSKKLAIVSADEQRGAQLRDHVASNELEYVVTHPTDALARLRERAVDLLVADLASVEGWPAELLEALGPSGPLGTLHVLLYDARAPGTDSLGRDVPEASAPEASAPEAVERLLAARDARRTKLVHGPEQLLQEVTGLLHLSETGLTPELQKVLRDPTWSARPLAGRHVLIVDDDVRNIFALTTVLEQYSMRVTFAENGADALRKLDEDTPDLVLMDIMMPEMDGYEATRRIREREGSSHLPVIALTAKAMKGDREKCLEAGASDYVTKPVNPEHLLSVLRVWLHP